MTRIKNCILKEQTTHVEVVGLLSKLDVDHHIQVELDEEDLNEVGVRKDVTYPEIKEFVLEKHGLKVSSLYIAQVKNKLGLIERENFNKSKRDNPKVPNCPPEKEEAIKEALEWFGMI